MRPLILNVLNMIRADVGINKSPVEYRFRFGLFKNWLKHDLDDHKCAARVINRMLTEDAWKKGVTRGYLMLTLCHRLGCDVNEELSSD